MGRKVNREKIERLFIRKSGELYAVKYIKSLVNPGDVGIEIRNIKMTQRDVLLEIKGGECKATALEKAILDNVQGTEVNLKRDEIVLHIYNIDVVTDKANKDRAIEDTIDVDLNLKGIKTDIILRLNRFGGHTATMIAPPGIARSLINLGRINIG